MTSATIKNDPPDESQRSTRQWILNWLNRAQFILYTFLILCFLAIGYLWQRMFIVIPPGYEGVMYRTIAGGTVTCPRWGEGLHVIPPWDKLYLYDLRLQKKTLNFNVLSDEGLALDVQVVVQYRPNESELGNLQKDVGPDYFENLVQPAIESHIRRTFGGRPAHEVYASTGDVLQEMNQFPRLGKSPAATATNVASPDCPDSSGSAGSPGNPDSPPPYVHVETLDLIHVELPPIVEDAIAETYHQEQLLLAYNYKLGREAKEAERKRTEAAGIRDFNLIAGKVDPDMLRWRSIDAALELAKSNNSKVVVLGGGQTGMTMQLNLGDTAGSASPPADGTSPPQPSPARAALDQQPAVSEPSAQPPAAPTSSAASATPPAPTSPTQPAMVEPPDSTPPPASSTPIQQPVMIEPSVPAPSPPSPSTQKPSTEPPAQTSASPESPGHRSGAPGHRPAPSEPAMRSQQGPSRWPIRAGAAAAAAAAAKWQKPEKADRKMRVDDRRQVNFDPSPRPRD